MAFDWNRNVTALLVIGSTLWLNSRFAEWLFGGST